MRAAPRWLTWRLEWEPPTPKHPSGNWTKVPYNARTGRLGSSTKPERWTDFEIAWRCYQDSLIGKNPYSGIGFVLGDGWVAIDIDGYRNPDTGALETRGREVLERIHGYCEVSPSGTGVHVVCRGAVPAGRREWDEPNRDHTGVAIYPDGRYLAITGCQLAESAPIEDCTAEIAALHAWLSSSNGNPDQARTHSR
jgi:putative DNA primase/helicase